MIRRILSYLFPGPFLVNRQPDIETRRFAPGYIRVNDWEFIPVHGGNMLPRDQVVTSEFYWDMKNAEHADRAKRDDFGELLSAAMEAETQEIEVVPEDGETIDDIYEELGGEA